MATHSRKRDSSAPDSSPRRRYVRGKKAEGPWEWEPLRDEAEVDIAKVINNEQMTKFRKHLKAWIDENATEGENAWSQSQIAEKLGITQPELSGWKRDTARPGIVTLIYMRKKLRMSIEVMLGLPPVGVR